jgi:hypothetical protein
MVVIQIRGTILTDPVARVPDEQRASSQTLRNLPASLDSGQTIPLSQVATVQYGLEQPVIWRHDLLPTITVHAGAIRGPGGGGAVRGPRGGGAAVGAAGGAAVRGPMGGGVARGPAGGAAIRGPMGVAAPL